MCVIARVARLDAAFFRDSLAPPFFYSAAPNLRPYLTPLNPRAPSAAGKTKEQEQGRVDKELANVRMAFAGGKMSPCVRAPPRP